MPPVLFWIIIAAVIAAGVVLSFFFKSFTGIMSSLIIGGLVVYIHYTGTGPAEVAGTMIPNGGGNQMMEFMAVSGFWFWVVFILGFGSTFGFWVAELPNAAFSILVPTCLLLLGFTFGLDVIWSAIWGNKLLTLGCLSGYFFMAALVAIFKWHLHNLDDAENYQDKVTRHYSFFGQDQSKWSDAAKKVWQDIGVYKQLLAENHKSLLIGWMMYWPLHLVDTIIREIFWKIFKRMYQWLIPLLNHISGRIARRVQPLT